MKTPISYYGGKQQLLPTILPLIPDHDTYTEAFFGGGAVFWGKAPARCEVINDVNGNVVNFYRVLKTKYHELKAAIDGTLHSKEVYKHATAIYAMPWLFDDVTRAWAFWNATQQAFHHCIYAGWTFDKEGKRTKTLMNRIDGLMPVYADRLKTVMIEQNDATLIIERWDNDRAFHYVDPPYLNADQGHYGGYTEVHFERLLNVLSMVKGKFLLSTYPHPVLDEFVKRNGWHQREVVMHLSAAKTTGKKKVEVLTGNYVF